MTNLNAIVSEFVNQLTAAIESATIDRMRVAVAAAVGFPAPKRVGRLPKQLATLSPVSRPRKRAPLQLCPVPGCRNPAAPIFGMVCSKHKDVPKAVIKKYREERRAKKAAASGQSATRRPQTGKTPKTRRKEPRSSSRGRQGRGATRPRPKTLKAKSRKTISPTPAGSVSPTPTVQAAA